VDAQTLHELSHLTLRNWNGIEVGELRASPVLADLRLHWNLHQRGEAALRWPLSLWPERALWRGALPPP